ncbi:MAG: NTP transferase domain-containing protein [Actinomycetota bacterium]|nr:NTP transferase domain-containing protein [Actinomycetota bacterium]
MGITGAVLAAGRGVRMGGVEHKSLIPVENNEPLMHYILGGLQNAGIKKLMIVTGWNASEVEHFVNERWGGEAVSYVFNARYGSWGNFHSLRVAVDQAPADDLLVVNCDVVVHPDVFRRVMETEGDLVLAVERRLRLDEEDMRVHLEGDAVRGIGKHLPRGRSHAEFCGVSLLRREARRIYQEVATDVEWRSETSIYYEDVYARMLDRVDARAAYLNEGEYAEVDEPANVADANAVIERYADEWRREPAADPQP